MPNPPGRGELVSCGAFFAPCTVLLDLGVHTRSPRRNKQESGAPGTPSPPLPHSKQPHPFPPPSHPATPCLPPCNGVVSCQGNISVHISLVRETFQCTSRSPGKHLCCQENISAVREISQLSGKYLSCQGNISAVREYLSCQGSISVVREMSQLLGKYLSCQGNVSAVKEISQLSGKYLRC